MHFFRRVTSFNLLFVQKNIHLFFYIVRTAVCIEALQVLTIYIHRLYYGAVGPFSVCLAGWDGGANRDDNTRLAGARRNEPRAEPAQLQLRRGVGYSTTTTTNQLYCWIQSIHPRVSGSIIGGSQKSLDEETWATRKVVGLFIIE